MDISKYFYTYINKTIDKFNDRFSTEIPHYENGRGLSIGAVVSQFLAIYYLGDLDRYIKEDLKQKYYIRYMDDLTETVLCNVVI